jgi:hypothetical protein
LSIFVGSKPTLIRRPCTFDGSRMARRRRIRLRGANCGPCANFGARAAENPFVFVSERGAPFSE